MRLCRYVVYSALIAVCFFLAWSHGKHLPWWTVTLVVLPSVVHLSLLSSLQVCRWAHVGEAMALPVILLKLTDVWALTLGVFSVQLVFCVLVWRWVGMDHFQKCVGEQTTL